MAFKLDATLLEQAGLPGLSAAASRQLVSELYDTLELLVGKHLADQMSERELDDFDALFDANDEVAMSEWFARHQPDSPDIVRQELGRLLGVLRLAATTMIPQSERSADEGP